MTSDKIQYFLNPETKEIVRISPRKGPGPNPLRKDEASGTAAFMDGRKIPGVACFASIQDFCRQYGMKRIDKYSEQELCEKIKRKAGTKGERVIFIVADGEDAYKSRSDAEGTVVGCIVHDKSGDPYQDEMDMRRDVDKFTAWAKGEIYTARVYDLDGNLIRTKVCSLGAGYTEKEVSTELKGTWQALAEVKDFKTTKALLEKKRKEIRLSDLKYDFEKGMRVVNIADYMRNAYFWRSGGSSGLTRYEHEWDEGGHHYYACFSTSSYYTRVFTYRDYRKDGVKTNLKAIHNSLMQIKKEICRLESEVEDHAD